VAWAGPAASRGARCVTSMRTTGSSPANISAKEMITTAFVPVAKPAPSPSAPMAMAAAAQNVVSRPPYRAAVSSGPPRLRAGVLSARRLAHLRAVPAAVARDARAWIDRSQDSRAAFPADRAAASSAAWERASAGTVRGRVPRTVTTTPPSAVRPTPVTNVCDMEAVTTRRIGHAAGQRVDVPVCAPCAVAGVTPAQG
jgi:hypothetical protein